MFCDDEYLLKQNKRFLRHDTLTDIITFDGCMGAWVQGNILISLERVGENATKYGVPMMDETLRVLAHGVLHLCGYKDKAEDEAILMRKKENESISLFYECFYNRNQ